MSVVQDVQQSARDVANEAEAHLVPLTQTGMSFLLCCAVSDGDDWQDGPYAAQSAECIEAVERVVSYLAETFRPSLVACTGGLSDELSDAFGEIQKTVGRLHHKFDEMKRDASPDRIMAMERFLRRDVASAVTTFLAALFAQVVEHERSSAKLAQDVDANALSQIDTISRQINFIAVNASVEAARVGDAGRGFAVIASEIKALSDQSRQAVDRMRQVIG